VDVKNTNEIGLQLLQRSLEGVSQVPCIHVAEIGLSDFLPSATRQEGAKEYTRQGSSNPACLQELLRGRSKTAHLKVIAGARKI
jgi:hypothetical protein